MKCSGERLAAARSGGTAGFSLLEMIIALGLFTLIGIAGVMLVQSILGAQRRGDESLARLSEVQRALHLLALDLQTVPPTSLAVADRRLAMVRRDDEARRVTISYALVDDMLVRTVGAQRHQVLLSDVVGLSWRFHLARRGWIGALSEDRREQPDGIELTLTTEREGVLRRVVDLMDAP